MKLVARAVINPHIRSMTARKPRSDGSPARPISETQARKALQADEGRIAMAEYRREGQAVLDRRAALRAARLSQAAVTAPNTAGVRKQKK